MKQTILLIAAAALAILAIWAFFRHESAAKEIEAEKRQQAPSIVAQQNPPRKLKETVERYEDGSKKAVHHVLESAPQIKEGLSTEYYRNGNVRSETNYVMNVPSGRFALRAEDGALALEGTLKNGLRDGRFTEWHPDGRVKIECGYKNGLLDGAWTEYYDADGSPKKVEARYSDGVPVGRYVIYKIDGLVKEERAYGPIPDQPASVQVQDAASTAPRSANAAQTGAAAPHDCSDAPLSDNAAKTAPAKP